MEEYNTIRYEIKDKVATIQLNRPDAYNTFTPEMNHEITSALKHAEKRKDVRSIVITGVGKAFSAGQDLKAIEPDIDFGEFLRNNYHPMIQTLRSMSKPTVAAVNGVAAGAGMSLALATDFRIIHSDAKFVIAFLGIALVPDAGFMYILPRLVGYAKAIEILTVREQITSEEAFQLGLATEVIDANEWDVKVARFANKLASLPPKAFALVKRYMGESMNVSFETFLEQEARAQRIASLTEDHQEGVNAFLEKRKPQFIGK